MEKHGLEPSWLRVFDNFNDAVVIVQSDGEILHANQAHLKLFGFGAHEVIGRRFVEFIGETERSKFDRAMRYAVAGEPDTTVTLTLQYRDGREVTTSISVSRVVGQDGLVPAFALFMRDAELTGAFERNTHLLASIVNGSHDAIIAKNLDGFITSWNAAAVSLFGYTADQAIGRSITMLFPMERLIEEADIMARIRRGEQVRHYEAKRLAKDGAVLDLSVTVSPIYDSIGRVVGASKIARDMREERLRTDRLAVLASVYQYCGEAIMILDSHGQFVEVNAAFTAITGFSETDMIGKSYNSFRSGRQSTQEARRMIRDLRRKHICKGEIWTRRKDGSALAGFLTVTALKGAISENRYIAILADVTSLRLQQEKLERLAHYDDLTGLPNRLLLHDRLDHALLQTRMHEREVSVAFLDIDGFKVVNDRHGHDAGDEILAILAKRMASCVLPTDTVARVGGDEFVLILPHARGKVHRTQVFDMLLQRIRQPVRLGGQDIHVTASIGVATSPPDLGEADQLMRLADQAMYEAKKHGGNQVRHFDSERQIREQLHRRLVDDVQMALDENQLEVYFQPQVHLASGAIVGAEALLRWVHPVDGMKLPGAFLMPLMDHPIIEDIGAFVVDRALDAITQFATVGLGIPVSINVTARELRRTNFASFLRRETERHKIEDMSLLRLELLETAALDDDPQITKTLAQCHKEGFGLAIDDFGVGFASLSYLGRIPADTIKLDRSFVMKLETDEASFKIATAVIAMAQAFGKSVVAEGLESPAVAQKLLAMECPIGQGFAIARAMPLTQFLKWANSWNQRLAVLQRPFVGSDLLVTNRSP